MANKKQGTSKFVIELLNNWVNEITSEDTLNQLQIAIEARRASLRVEVKDNAVENCIAQYQSLHKSKTTGTTLYTIMPLPIKKGDKSKYARNEQLRMSCTFWQWKPRKKLLWVVVPWQTGRNHFQHEFICLNMADIKRFQPSRTETNIRRP
jgi:hypothetical protein